MSKTALLIVDPQKDFCPGGALPVASGDAIMEPLNRAIGRASIIKWPILVSRDWHPAVTTHFVTHGGPWPVHCVQNTPGAQFHERLIVDEESDVIISKAMRPDEDGYSPLCANAYVGDGRSAVDYLQDEDIDTLYIGGLATDYCVKAGVLDALKLPFIKKVYLLTDAIGAVDINPGDGQRAIDEMVAAGAVLTTTAEVIGEEA